MSVLDRLQRPLRDLRVSVTDRCNLRCPYCMPAEVYGPDHVYLRGPEVLTAEEIVSLARVFRALGVEKVRLTGGEPLLRPELPEIVRGLKARAGIPEVTVTTNGVRLAARAAELREAGLDRLNVSLDALDPEVCGRMNGRGRGPAEVLAGLGAAGAAGFSVKVNMVVVRGLNDREVVPLAALARERSWTLRFIEYMDVGTTNGWSPEQVVPASEVLAALAVAWPLEPVEPAYRGEVAVRHRYLDGRGEVGFIRSVTEPFCGDCHRARLSADGRLFTCLFAAEGVDLRGPLRAGEGERELAARVAAVWAARRDRYSEERAELRRGGRVPPKAEMSYLGG